MSNVAKRKKSITLTTRIIAITMIAVVITAVVSISVSLISMSNVVKMVNKSVVDATVITLQNEMDYLQEKARTIVCNISKDQNVSLNIVTNNKTCFLPN